MQSIALPHIEIFPLLIRALQRERLLRYLPASSEDERLAFSIYLWNGALCEAFYCVIHFAEIVCRNALHDRLLERVGERWFENATFLGILDDRFRRDLIKVTDEERRLRGAAFTAHHVVARLTLGFWEHLLTKRFKRLLWSEGVHPCFPHAPSRMKTVDLSHRVAAVRRLRNRIAHHEAIFDKKPMKTHQEAIELISWVCSGSGSWVASVSKVPAVIARRPKA